MGDALALETKLQECRLRPAITVSRLGGRFWFQADQLFQAWNYESIQK